MKKLVCIFLVISQISSSQNTDEIELNVFPPSRVSFDDFKTLVAKVETHRAERLVNLNTFFSNESTKKCCHT